VLAFAQFLPRSISHKDVEPVLCAFQYQQKQYQRQIGVAIRKPRSRTSKVPQSVKLYHILTAFLVQDDPKKFTFQIYSFIDNDQVVWRRQIAEPAG
jgi:hypothetical protein